jgi:hypothetical protein
VSCNGDPTPPLTLPVYRGILSRLVCDTRATWEAGRALWGRARRKSSASPARKQGRRRAGKGRRRKRRPHCHGVDRGASVTLRRKAADFLRV